MADSWAHQVLYGHGVLSRLKNARCQKLLQRDGAPSRGWAPALLLHRQQRNTSHTLSAVRRLTFSSLMWSKLTTSKTHKEVGGGQVCGLVDQLRE